MKVKTCPFDLTCLLVLTHLSSHQCNIYIYLKMNGWPHSSHSFLQLTVAEVLFYFFVLEEKCW